jgi:hypothetical protein
MAFTLIVLTFALPLLAMALELPGDVGIWLYFSPYVLFPYNTVNPPLNLLFTVLHIGALTLGFGWLARRVHRLALLVPLALASVLLATSAVYALLALFGIPPFFNLEAM